VGRRGATSITAAFVALEVRRSRDGRCIRQSATPKSSKTAMPTIQRMTFTSVDMGLAGVSRR